MDDESRVLENAPRLLGKKRGEFPLWRRIFGAWRDERERVEERGRCQHRGGGR